MTRFIFIVVLALIANAHGRWRKVETAAVPVERVLSNLTNRAESKTNDFELLHAIARLHSLSYARAASNWMVDIETNSPQQLPWFRRSLPLPPPAIIAPTNSAAQKIAKVHLEQAIEFYRRAITLQPTNEFVYLGLGWCAIQAGRTNDAKVALRRAIELGQSSKSMSWISLFPTTSTEEAVDYLTPLLHPIIDIHELDTLSKLKAEVARARQRGQAYTPLVLPLQPNLTPADLINTNASVTFDLDGSGAPNRRWQWINTNAAWIVHLPQGGPVTSALQMFGNVTFWMFWENGYHALASLDDNADGQLTGEELRGIRLWHDQNSNGKSEPTEILELHQLDITALDTRYTTQHEIPTSPTGARLADGSTRPTYDIILRRTR